MKIQNLLFITLSTLSLSSTLFADEDNLGTCTYLDSLKQNVLMSDYQQCISKINQCPKNGPYLDGMCVKKQLEQESACKQLNQLAQQLNVSADLIHLQQKAGFTMIDVIFPADGGHQYALLSSDGCLIDTLVDPRDLDPSVKKEYEKSDFYLEAKEKPSYVQKSDGNQQFIADIVVKNQCRACAIIGTAKIAFSYTKDGTWLKTELLSFTKE